MASDDDKTQNIMPMSEVRAEIDRVDMALLGLIAERMELARAVRRAKSGVDVWRPSREESHVRHLADLAGDTPPALVSRIWAELTSASLALQGPIRLHVALEGDVLKNGELVRDRFGAAIPIKTYPTGSAALAAAHSEPEGVAVLPAPGGMSNWWTALGPSGAASNMNILSALPRIGTASWPRAVAVSKAERLPSGSDQTLIFVEAGRLSPQTSAASIFAKAGLAPVLRAEIDGRALYSVPEYLADESAAMDVLKSAFAAAKVIGVLPNPIALSG